MNSKRHNRPYRYLAEHYDSIFGPFSDARDAAREAVVASILPQVHSACDLACGTGTTAVKLARDAAPFFINSVVTRGCRTLYLARKALTTR